LTLSQLNKQQIQQSAGGGTTAAAGSTHRRGSVQRRNSLDFAVDCGPAGFKHLSLGKVSVCLAACVAFFFLDVLIP
jgi:hypothetical protein